MHDPNNTTHQALRARAEQDAGAALERGELTADSVMIAQMALRYLDAVRSLPEVGELSEEEKALYVVAFALTALKHL